MARGFPTRTACESTVAVAPRPGWARKPSAGGISIPICRGMATSSRAMGCSEYCSTAAASRSTAAAVKRGTVSTRSTRSRARVSVPVLSKTTAFSRPRFSSTAPPLTRIPRRTRKPMPAATAVGVASTKAHGQATTSTATLRDRSRVTQNVTRRRHQDRGDEIAGIAVGQSLDRGLRRFGMLDEMDDPLERRVVAQPLDGQFQRPVGIQRAGEDLVAGRFFGRQRLAGDRALIDPRRAAE